MHGKLQSIYSRELFRAFHHSRAFENTNRAFEIYFESFQKLLRYVAFSIAAAFSLVLIYIIIGKVVPCV